MAVVGARGRNAGVPAGWLGCVLAAEWGGRTGLSLPANSRVCADRQRDAAGPAGGTPAFRRVTAASR
jgi:hypothetical protein